MIDTAKHVVKRLVQWTIILTAPLIFIVLCAALTALTLGPEYSPGVTYVLAHFAVGYYLLIVWDYFHTATSHGAL